MAADESARWRILGESAWEKSERGYLLDTSGGKKSHVLLISNPSPPLMYLARKFRTTTFACANGKV